MTRRKKEENIPDAQSDLGFPIKIINQSKISNLKSQIVLCHAHSVTIDLADISHQMGYLCLSH